MTPKESAVGALIAALLASNSTIPDATPPASGADAPPDPAETP